MAKKTVLYAVLSVLLIPCTAQSDDTFKGVGHTLGHGIENASNFLGNALEDTGKAIKHVEHGSTAGASEAGSSAKQRPQSKDHVSGSTNQQASTAKNHFQGLLHNLWR